MPSPVVRPATATDVEAVLAFWKLAADNHTDRNDTAGAVERLLDHDPQALLLAEHESEIAGTLIAGWDGWRAHLYRFAVRPDLRRHGIGRALLAAAERRFAGAGGWRVDAIVVDDNQPAHQVWAAYGFEVQSWVSRWVKDLADPAADDGR